MVMSVRTVILVLLARLAASEVTEVLVKQTFYMFVG